MPDESRKSWWDEPAHRMLVLTIAGAFGFGPFAANHLWNKPKPAPPPRGNTFQEPLKIWQSQPSTSPQKGDRNLRKSGFGQDRPL